MKVLGPEALARPLEAGTVIVGSGAGGAVVAAELAEAGEDVLVLEEGDHHPPEALAAMSPAESLRRVWRDGGTALAVGLGDTPHIAVQLGRAVGGSSILTGGVCFRIPEAVLAEWRERHGLADYTPEGLEPFYRSVEEAIHVEEVPEAARSRSTALFAEGARALGYALKPIRRNTLGCEGRGLCNFGCPHQAKRSVDLTYLPRAVAAGARIVSGARVDRVELRDGRARGVVGRTAAGRRFRVRAGRVVVAAGAWHTPLLLRRSGIGRRSGQVGRNMTLHPAFRVSGLFEERVDGWKGALQSAFADAFEDEGITLVSFFVPPSVLVSTIPGAGPRFVEEARRAGHLAVFGGILHDEGGGRVRRGPGREPLVTYRMARRDRAAVPRLLRLLAETWFAAGARRVYLPVAGLDPVDADAFARLDLESVPARKLECTSQHPLGTARMGADPESAVVDPDGRSWEVPNLYVADGSVLPTSLGVNPQLAIMTVAARIAWRMVGKA